MSDRYVSVIYLREDDDRRRWLVIDIEKGNTVATCAGESSSLLIARALNRGADVDAAVEAVTERSPQDMIHIPYPAACLIADHLRDHGEYSLGQTVSDAIADVEPF